MHQYQSNKYQISLAIIFWRRCLRQRCKSEGRGFDSDGVIGIYCYNTSDCIVILELA